ncbi:TPA: Lar family restriction alleviation protein [Vibrio vulnificus]|nr:Lar family restriction alleviation protein [Vibrio vulnificus]
MSTYIPLHYLKPCGKCHSSAVFCESTLDDTPRYFVFCNDCGFEGVTADSRQNAITLWNAPPTNKPVRRYKEY